MNVTEDFLASPRPFNFLRLGIHGERKYFQENAELFRGIALNGSIVALTPEATAAFLRVKMGGRQPFFVDPLTYAFGVAPTHIAREDGQVKRSIAKMADFYGKALSRSLGKRPLHPADLESEDAKDGLCRGVLGFQKSVLSDALADDIGYYREIDPEMPDVIVRPAFLAPPYFYLHVASWQDWIELNTNLVERSIPLADDLPVFSEIVLGREFLHRPHDLNSLALAYTRTKCQGFVFWISDFPEYSATVDEIISLRRFVKTLSSKGRPVINLYGGYLSALLHFDGLSGFCHGPGYGEDRDIVPVGGGLPYPKYYFTPLHRRVPSELVESFLLERRIPIETFYSTICGCATCRQTLRARIINFARFGETAHVKRADGLPISYATEEAKEISNFHYLHARSKELSDVSSSSKNSLLEQLEQAEQRYLGDFKLKWTSHLAIWRKALAEAM